MSSLQEQQKKGREAVRRNVEELSSDTSIKEVYEAVDQQTTDTWKAAQEAVSITQLLEILDDRYQQLNREND
jgi:hypothetical protein